MTKNRTNTAKMKSMSKKIIKWEAPANPQSTVVLGDLRFEVKHDGVATSSAPWDLRVGLGGHTSGYIGSFTTEEKAKDRVEEIVQSIIDAVEGSGEEVYGD